MVYIYIFSAAAIIGVAAILHALGFSRKNALSAPEEAVKLFQAEFPDEEIREIVFANDSHTALLALGRSGVLGVVTAFGSKWRCRIIETGDVMSATCRSDGTLRVNFRGYADPVLALRFTDDAVGKVWTNRIRALSGVPAKQDREKSAA